MTTPHTHHDDQGMTESEQLLSYLEQWKIKVVGEPRLIETVIDAKVFLVESEPAPVKRTPSSSPDGLGDCTEWLIFMGTAGPCHFPRDWHRRHTLEAGEGFVALQQLFGIWECISQKHRHRHKRKASRRAPR